MRKRAEGSVESIRGQKGTKTEIRKSEVDRANGKQRRQCFISGSYRDTLHSIRAASTSEMTSDKRHGSSCCYEKLKALKDRFAAKSAVSLTKSESCSEY